MTQGAAGLRPGIGGSPVFAFGGNGDADRNVTIWGAPFMLPASDNLNAAGSCTAGLLSSAQETAPMSDLPAPPPPPERPVRSVIHHYSWPEAGTNSTARFAIVGKDGQVRFAAAVWLQDGALNFTDMNGNAVRADLNTLDMESTRKLNAQAGLRWPLETR